MELMVPILAFVFAVYLLGSGRRRQPFLVAGERNLWAEDAQRRALRMGSASLDELKRSYGQFAAEREGRRLDRAPYEGPRVAYLHRSARAVLSLHVVARDDGQEDRFTQVAYAVPPGWRHRIEIGPATVDLNPDSPVPGLMRVTTGESDFDRRMRVLGSDAAIVRTILDAPTRRAIIDLQELLANGHVHLSASSSRVFLRKRGVIRDLPDVSLFARLADSVYDRLLLVWEREIGIEILDEPAAPDGEAPKCQVCSHPIAPESRVRCRRCRTPHHPDCWEFNGGCATFACGEKQVFKGAA
jgi:hypothetical protein